MSPSAAPSQEFLTAPSTFQVPCTMAYACAHQFRPPEFLAVHVLCHAVQQRRVGTAECNRLCDNIPGHSLGSSPGDFFFHFRIMPFFSPKALIEIQNFNVTAMPLSSRNFQFRVTWSLPLPYARNGIITGFTVTGRVNDPRISRSTSFGTFASNTTTKHTFPG